MAKMWYIYTMGYYSAVKRWNNAICSHMDGPRDYHSVWSKSVRERQILYDIPYMQNVKKKKRYKWTYLENRNRLKDLENEFMVTKKKG